MKQIIEGDYLIYFYNLKVSQWTWLWKQLAIWIEVQLDWIVEDPL